MRTYIIYIPGLGDRSDWFRIAALRTWRLWGVTTKHVPITWYDRGNFASKIDRIKKAIDTVPPDANIVLIGESAGATLALQTAGTDSRIKRVITLCGVARPDTPISRVLRQHAPALGEGVDMLADRYDLDVHSVRAFADQVVERRYSVVKGSTEHVIWSIGHLMTIGLCLTVLVPLMAAIAKK